MQNHENQANHPAAKEIIAALENVLALKLPQDCEIKLVVTDTKNPNASTELNLTRQLGKATRFNVAKLVGAMSEAHRT